MRRAPSTAMIILLLAASAAATAERAGDPRPDGPLPAARLPETLPETAALQPLRPPASPQRPAELAHRLHREGRHTAAVAELAGAGVIDPTTLAAGPPPQPLPAE